MNDEEKENTQHLDRISRISFVCFAVIVISIVVVGFLALFSNIDLGLIVLYIFLPLCGLMFILMIPENYVSIHKHRWYRERTKYQGVILLFFGAGIIAVNTYLILFVAPVISVSVGLYSLGSGIIINGVTHILFLKKFHDKVIKEL